MLESYPFVKQEDQKECGPVCLQMIIKYYKGYIDLEYLNYLCKTNKYGTNAYNLINGAKEIGFDSYAVKANIDELKGSVFPLIAHVVIKNKYNHYVVIYKINYNKKYLIVADPANKIKKVSFDEFNTIFSNIVIFLFPVKKIPQNKNVSLINYLSNILINNYKSFLPLFLLSFIITIFTIVSSFYFKIMLDNYNNKNYIILIFILFIIFNLIKTLTNYFRNKVTFILNEKIDLDITCNTYKNIINLPYNYYKNHTTGDVISRVTKLNDIRELINKVFISIFMDLPLSLVSFITLYIISSKLFYITILLLLLYILIILIYILPSKNIINKINEENSNVTSYLYETISGFETVKGLNIKDKIIRTFYNKYSKLLEEIFKFNNLNNNQMLLKEIVFNTTNLVIIFTGILLITKNEITIGTLITFNTILSYFLEPIINILNLNSNIIEAKTSLKRVLNILEYKKDNGIIDKPFNNIKVSNLTYKIDNNTIINNLNINIEKSEKVMIVGSSGTGKSTLLKIILKYYEVKRNNIFLNDIDINDYKNNSIHKNISYISQNEILFTDTILNNLTICSNEKIIEISKLCYIDEILKDKNLGYNYLLEENGFNVSGGQKQRIILARALLKPFNILIIDEGLNELDIALERKILKNIFNYFKNKTIIIVSHRLENKDLFDKIINLDLCMT